MIEADDAPGVLAAVLAQERRLLTELSAGAAVSAVAGTALWVSGRRRGRSQVAAFGRQNLLWAVVDGAIAAWGWRGTGSAPSDGVEAIRHAGRLRSLTAVNAALDVGYVAGGAVLAARAPRRRGDGLAIVVQGAFLLWLDARHCARFHALARPR